jgi:hypothetical protein
MLANSNWPFDPKDFARYVALPEMCKAIVFVRVSKGIQEAEGRHYRSLLQKEHRVQKAKSTTKLSLIKGGQS